MLDTSKPDPRVYKLAANKVRMGVDHRKAIMSSIEDLHPEVKKNTPFQLGIFNWRWEHLHQYKSAFGEIKPQELKPEVPKAVRHAQNLLVAASLDLMADVCSARFN